MTNPLAARFQAAPPQPLVPCVAALAARLGEEAKAQAVLFYGSNLRTGSLEGVLDFYVLLPGPAETGIWPRVSYLERAIEGTLLRAKIATMKLATFASAAAGERIDTTIWARFAQPSMVVWARSDTDRAQVDQARCAAAATAAKLAVALGPARAGEADYWRCLFRATYEAEFRVERPGRESSILEANPGHFAGLLPEALDAASIAYAIDGEQIVPQMAQSEREAVLAWWNERRRLGKPLNLVRLLRATTTFKGALRYAIWKIRRHRGRQ